MQTHYVRTFAFFLVALGLLVARAPRLVAAQSSQVEIEWSLFNGILIVGIIVGIVVFGLLFYAIIRYREKPARAGVTQ